MRIFQWVVLTAVFLSAAGMPALAGESSSVVTPPSGSDIVSRIEQATSSHVEVLSSLVTQVPEAARVGLERALTSARKGHDATLSALTPRAKPGGRGSKAEGAGDAARLDWTEVMRARGEVSESFHESIAAIRTLIRRNSDLAPSPMKSPLADLRDLRAVALQNFDRLLAVQKPGVWALQNGDREASAGAARASRSLQQQGSQCQGHASGGSTGHPGHP